MRIAPEGLPVIACVVAVCALSVTGAWLLWSFLGLALLAPALLVILWAFWFFRDPERTPPPGEDLVISPADGVVIGVDEAPVPPEVRTSSGLGDSRTQRITIFLNIFNVHVNRVPVTGFIEHVAYRPGKFLTASLDKAGEENERSVAVIRDDRGRVLVMAQIAGMIARRIVNHLKQGQSVRVGERFGLIRFGSRAEIWLPVGSTVQVHQGQKMTAGETILARMPLAAASVEAKPASVMARHAGGGEL